MSNGLWGSIDGAEAVDLCVKLKENGDLRLEASKSS